MKPIDHPPWRVTTEELTEENKRYFAAVTASYLKQTVEKIDRPQYTGKTKGQTMATKKLKKPKSIKVLSDKLRAAQKLIKKHTELVEVNEKKRLRHELVAKMLGIKLTAQIEKFEAKR